MLSALGCANGEEAENISNAKPQDASSDTAGDVVKDGAKDVADEGVEEGGPTECVPKTCAQLEAECGSAPDGCGGKIDCGECMSGQVCGGGGPNRCGTSACFPKSCVQLGAQCGYISDGCATAIDCGTCAAPQTCGGGGKSNECGCTPKTCSQLGASCGVVPDGCNGTLNCGDCAGGQVCGGAGPNVCGTGECTPKTCAQVGASCGYASDGCSKALDCGKCDPPDQCGGSGVANQCGCTPKTCGQLGANCGPVDTGCGSADCGSCDAPDTCGGGGVPNQCGCTCSLPNAVTSCLGGVCMIKSCNAGWADCDGIADNGCEANLATNKNNCGSCGKICADVHGAAVCVAGDCNILCDSGWGNCDGNAANGCETDTRSDPAHCSGCGRACSTQNFNPACEAGKCTGSCHDGYADCNNDKLIDGCEANTSSDPANCGGCGIVCSSQNISVTCAQGICNGVCATGYDDCNGNKQTDGCETHLLNNLDACGSCGNSCRSPMPPNVASVACNGTTCEVESCESSYVDEDHQFANGCECLSDTVSDSCSTPTLLGTIGLSTWTSPTYSIMPAGDRDWFRGTLNMSVSTCTQRPRIRLLDQSGLLRMAVYDSVSCPPSSGYACGTGNSTTGIRTWEFGHSATCQDMGTIDPTPVTGSYSTISTSFLIEVYSSDSAASCLPYQLEFTRY
ncbi:MAG TPA: hypothetical protein PK710_12825 [Polyangiaceae bacterium]|nr:hypothetical protein [Polyangiaceae bacterium]